MACQHIHTKTKSTVWSRFIKSNEVSDENDGDDGDNYDGDNNGDEKMTMKLDFLKEQTNNARAGRPRLNLHEECRQL